MRYGTIDGAVKPEAAAAYGIRDSGHGSGRPAPASRSSPTKTGVAVVVRGVRQSLSHTGGHAAQRLGQGRDLARAGSLGDRSDALRLGLQLLVALESARNTNLSEKDDALDQPAAARGSRGFLLNPARASQSKITFGLYSNSWISVFRAMQWAKS